MDIDKDHIFQHLRMNDEFINTTEQKKLGNNLQMVRRMFADYFSLIRARFVRLGRHFTFLTKQVSHVVTYKYKNSALMGCPVPF